MANNFRTNSKLHFLTYPQCDVPLQEIQKQLKEKAGNKYGWTVISAEDHEERENDTNVGVHRHAMMELNAVINIKNAKWWDIVYEDKVYHPHFEPAKNKTKCLQYTIKDGNYIVDGTYKELPFSVDTYLEANGSKKQGYGFTYIATELKKGKTIDELDDVIPGHILNHKRKIDDYIQFLKQKKVRQTIKPKFLGFKDVEDPTWQQVVEWANLNFLQPRRPRQPQLWLWSRQPEMGKSFPWSILMREYKTCYEWIYGSKQGKEILECDYILIDELKGGITVTELKSISQMYGLNLDLKYGDVQFFNKNVPLIITSNRPPREIYHKCATEDMESLESRFLIVEVNEQCFIQPKTEVILEASPPRQEELQIEEASPHVSPTQRVEEDHSEFSNEEYELMQDLANKPKKAKKTKKQQWLDKYATNLINKDK